MKKWAFFAFAVLAAMIMRVATADASDTAGEQAGHINNHTDGWETLWGHLLWDIGVIGVTVFVMAAYFMVKYKRKNESDVGQLQEFSFSNALAWALIPTFIFLADDFYLAASGWKLWIDQRTVPEDAVEVEVTARMWGWDFTYPDGSTTSSDVEYDDNGNVTGVDGEGLVVQQGKPVVLRMTSDDVVHSFSIPAYRIKEDVMPGRVTYLWFEPRETGKLVYTCTEFCGTNHSRMFGTLSIVGSGVSRGSTEAEDANMIANAAVSEAGEAMDEMVAEAEAVADEAAKAVDEAAAEAEAMVDEAAKAVDEAAAEAEAMADESAKAVDDAVKEAEKAVE